MERTYFEVYERLKKNSHYSESFCESYKECYELSRLNGKFFHGTWEGYAVKPDGDDKTYFSEEGIRGCCHGLFVVIDGTLHEVTDLNEWSKKDKYSDFVRDIWEYIDLKRKSLEKLESIPEVSYDTKVQVDEHKNTLNTLLTLLGKY